MLSNFHPACGWNRIIARCDVGQSKTVLPTFDLLSLSFFGQLGFSPLPHKMLKQKSRLLRSCFVAGRLIGGLVKCGHDAAAKKL
jgi:hypothetical protein